MKKALFVGISLAAVGTAPALAADLAPRMYSKAPAYVPAPIYSWAGFYIGLNGGGGSSHNCWDITQVGAFAVAPSVREGCHDATGGMAGGQIGYRWQSASWVFGVEGQGDWADFKGSNTSLFPSAFGVTNESKVNALGLLTGQVGYAWNNVLWYVKGGAAVTSDRYHGIINATGVYFDAATETRWGGTVGTGVEFSFAPNWSVAFEYDHLFMGDRNITFTNTATGVLSRNDNIRQDVDIGSVRVNYRWGGPVIAKY